MDKVVFYKDTSHICTCQLCKFSLTSPGFYIHHFLDFGFNFQSWRLVDETMIMELKKARVKVLRMINGYEPRNLYKTILLFLYDKVVVNFDKNDPFVKYQLYKILPNRIIYDLMQCQQDWNGNPIFDIHIQEVFEEHLGTHVIHYNADGGKFDQDRRIQEKD